MNKKNDTYWERRKAELIYQQMDKAEAKADDIDKIYNEAQRYLNKQADKVFDKFQRDYGLSETDARQVLKDMKGKRSLSEMRKVLEARPEDPNINQLLADMDSGAYAFRLNRFNELSQQVDRLRNAMYQAEKKQSDRFYPDLMKDSYNRATFNLQQHTGLAYHFNELPEAEIKRLSHLKWSGDNYSGRIWNNTGELARQLKNELLVSWMTGRSNRGVINSISERFNAGRNNARRLVRTESAFFHNEMEALSYKDADIEQYRFVAVLDKRTSAICRKHDNKVYKVSERKTGVNYPPLHPWCRSTTIAHFEDMDLSKLERRARDPETGKAQLVPADMSYDDWYDKYVKDEKVVKNNEEAIEHEENNKIFIADKASEIDNFFKQQKSYQKWYNGLSEEQKKAINYYTREEGYTRINGILRNGKENYEQEVYRLAYDEDRPYIKETIKEASQAMDVLKTVNDFVPEKSFKTYRGISFWDREDIYSELQIGENTILDRGFMSTSLDKTIIDDFADGGREYRFEITVPRGYTKGKYIGELSDVSHEKEFLFDPESKFKIIDIKTEGSVTKVVAEAIYD
ncbi:minor capsid protein [Streptococcus constellatus]|uniref:minor capsid protein n=1 Tax=Streptococcus constellatus TaxID=76860 RepID=UPI00210665D3|nr:minor capsid protein [Streptococcus constellatus]UTX63920.1 hypothetical protein DEH83_00585 [Streptococcus constellatus]